jgi:hypothetical protein
MIDRFFRPLFGGIQLDASLATSSRMFDTIFRTLAVGDSAVPARGMGEIPLQLVHGLPAGTVHLGARVTGLDGTTVRLDGDRSIEAERVVVATEGPAASSLLGLPPVASKPVSCVWFAADHAPFPEPLIVLDGEGTGPVLNLAVMSNVSAAYAPAGRAVIACACPGAQPTELEPLVRAQVRRWFGAQVERWRHLRTYHVAHGQPEQRPPFHPKRRVALGGGRFVCGDHRDTASIQGALFSGRRCGEAVVASLS